MAHPEPDDTGAATPAPPSAEIPAPPPAPPPVEPPPVEPPPVESPSPPVVRPLFEGAFGEVY